MHGHLDCNIVSQAKTMRLTIHSVIFAVMQSKVLFYIEHRHIIMYFEIEQQLTIPNINIVSQTIAI